MASNGQHQWYTAASGTAGATLSFTQAMTLDASGNLGIGTTTPSQKLSVVAGSGSSAYIEVQSTGYTSTLFGQNNAGDTYVYNGYAGNIRFFTGATERARIDSSGNLCVAATAPGAGFTGPQLVVGKSANPYGIIEIQGAKTGSDGSAGLLMFYNTSGSSRLAVISAERSGADNSGALAFQTWNAGTGAEAGRFSKTGGFSVGTTVDPGAGAIYATGNITAYYSSDIKFKENVQDIPDALGIVTAIGSKTFDWTDEYLAERGGEDEYFQPKQSFGVIAQDVQKVFPQAVRTREDGSLAVDYEKLAILSFGAIGQLLKRVEALESK